MKIFFALISLAYADPELGDSKEFMFGAVKERPSTLASASERLKSDKQLVIESLEKSQFGYSWQYVGENLKQDEDVLRTACNALIDSAKKAERNRFLLDHCTTD